MSGDKQDGTDSSNSSAGNGLERYETAYRELFVEALEDGVITEDERAQLKKAAANLGLDVGRLGTLEQALHEAYEEHHGVGALDTARMFGSMPPPPLEENVAHDDVHQEVAFLRRKVAAQEQRLSELQEQLDEAHLGMAVDVDFSDLDAPVPTAALHETLGLQRRLARDPRDLTSLHALFVASANDPDLRYRASLALDYLGEAHDPARECIDAVPADVDTLPNMTGSVDSDGWRRLLYHPEDEHHVSDILGVVVWAVLLAHTASLKRSGTLYLPDVNARLDPATTTVTAVRSIGWAAGRLGMQAPAIFAEPQGDFLAQSIPSVPPSLRLGKQALSGRSVREQLFVAGQQLAYFRRERFIRLLVPDMVDLQDLYLAALLIANRALPLHHDVRKRVGSIADAIEPVLSPAELDQLRGAYQRFVEHGGRTNLQRWARAADLTACRTGFALSGDLKCAEKIVHHSGLAQPEQCMDDLLSFLVSDRMGKLRIELGIALEPTS